MLQRHGRVLNSLSFTLSHTLSRTHKSQGTYCTISSDRWSDLRLAHSLTYLPTITCYFANGTERNEYNETRNNTLPRWTRKNIWYDSSFYFILVLFYSVLFCFVRLLNNNKHVDWQQTNRHTTHARTLMHAFASLSVLVLVASLDPRKERGTNEVKSQSIYIFISTTILLV